MRGTRYEVSSSGLDTALQGVWSDPFGGVYSTGLLIPQTIPTIRDYRTRLLFVLAFARFSAGRRVRLAGLRQMLTVASVIPTGDGATFPSYILEKEIGPSQPGWHFPDATWSWHVMRVQPGREPLANPANGDGYSFRYATAPTLLFESGGYDTAAYLPPNGGRPLGVPVSRNLGNLHDVRYPWVDDHAWSATDNIEIEGPCDIVFYASGQQTDPGTRTSWVLPGGGFPAGTDCLPEMDAFVANMDAAGTPAKYWRVAGSMIFEEENLYPQPRNLEEDETNPWCAPSRQLGGSANGSLDPPPGDRSGNGSGVRSAPTSVQSGGNAPRAPGNTTDTRRGGR